MGDEKDSTTRRRSGRVSRTHPVLGDSSPEARTSRLKTEVVPASMIGRLRDNVIAGIHNASTQSNLPMEPSRPIEPQLPTQGQSPSPSAPPVSPPPAPGASHPISGPIEEVSGEDDDSMPPKPKGILVDRRMAQQGRETIRQMREARGKRQVESPVASARAVFRMKSGSHISPRKLMTVAVGLGVGLIGLFFISTLWSSKTPPVVNTTPPTSPAVGEKSQPLPGSIFGPVSAPLAFPQLPSGLYTGIAKGIMAERDVSLTFISHDNGRTIGVALGIEGWLSQVVSATEKPYLEASSSGWVIRFLMKRASDDFIVGRWENRSTKEVGEWTVAPIR